MSYVPPGRERLRPGAVPSLGLERDRPRERFDRYYNPYEAREAYRQILGERRDRQQHEADASEPRSVFL